MERIRMELLYVIHVCTYNMHIIYMNFWIVSYAESIGHIYFYPVVFGDSYHKIQKYTQCKSQTPKALPSLASYLENHPRTCKWLGSPPFISHGKVMWKE